MKQRTKILAAILTLASLAQAESITPSSSHASPTNDTYIGYQWAIWNAGQKVSDDIDDIHPIEIVGSPGIQIGWKPTFDQMMKRDVVVAVIDSGLDTEHEDIQGHIALNEVECKDGHIPTSPTGDPDKNGFDGDCMGWNFATRIPQQAKLVDDDIGHGTHIAGIIAAVSNNGIGISGVSNRIKILPLKVYSGADETNVGMKPGMQKPESISDRVTRALDYAVSRKVDVINLSLGWPLVNNSEKAKAALRNAVDHGILVVAGAGNDHHDAQIYPCALEGVVCVGSVNIDGQVSRFSNYGGHVDALAPGDAILSLWPSHLLGSATVFGPTNYEILSGTSQATPYVSGVLAVLRGIYPNLPAKELRGKLLMAAAPSTANKEFTLRGLINMEKAINANTAGFVAPSFKELDHVVVNTQTGQFTLPVRLNNYGPQTQTVTVQVVSENPQVSFVQSSQTASIAADGLTTFSVTGKVQSIKASAALKYHVVVNNQTYTHQIFLIQDLMQNSRVQTYPFGENAPTTVPSSVKMINVPNSIPEYYTIEKTQNKTSLIKIYRPGKVGNQNQMILAGQMEAPITDLLPNLSVVKTDLNGDKKPDYFIGGFVRDDKDEVQAVRFSYFAGNFQPLFPGSNSIDLDFDGVLLGPLTLNFVTLSTKDFGTIAYPTFWAVAGVPKADADPDPFNFEPTDVQMHRFYFYELQRSGTGAVSFKTRLFDNSAFYKNLRKSLGIAVVQDLALMDSLGQSNADASQGILRLVGSYGTGILQTYFQVKIQGSQILNHESQILKMSVPSSVDLQHQPFDDMIIYNSSNGTSDFGTSITGIFSLNQARVIALDDRTQSTSFLSSINVSPADPMGQFAPAGKVHIQTFEMDRQTVSFFEGEDHLIAQGTFQGKQFHTESQIYRSSFLAGPIFSQLFYPVLVSNSGSTSKKPGLFVDNSKLFSPTAQIWTLDENNQLSIPLSLNYALPKNCQSMNPTRWSNQDVVVISCQSNGKLDKLMFMGL